ncbi:MAG: ATP synthase subunit I [Acidobacteriaceae bacterium]|nr:ATP synthase subunit I [Acidobacteriaceae bacterium]
MQALDSYTDDDFRKTVFHALKLLAAVAAVAALLLWWKMGWQSAVLLLVGAAVSGSGLFEWMQLMTAVMKRMDRGERAKPMAPVMALFFLRLALTLVVLYVSLKLLNGSVIALAAGLGLGVFALTVEGIRLVKAWTA